MPRLPKEHILRGYKTFAGVLTLGKVIACGSIKLFYIPADQSRQSRIGFSVSRSVRTAALRNRIRRCLRETYRLNQHLLQVPIIMDLVLMYTGPSIRKAGDVDCDRIARDVIMGFQRLVERTRKQ